MQIFINFLFLLIGFVFLIRGADYFIVSSSSIARKFNFSSLIIGLTLVALGTSQPELVTSIMATKKGENEIVLGNVVGSNISNVLIILSISGVVTPLGINGDILIDTV